MRESIGLSCTVPFRTQMRRSAATASGLYYDRVPLVMHSGCVKDSWRPFWPDRCRPREVQDGCQNGQPWLDALWPSPTVSHTGDENERRPQVAGRKNTRPSAVSVGARTWRARWKNSTTACYGRMVSFYEPRARALSSDSNAAFRRDSLRIILRPCVICHEFWLFT